MGSTSPAEAGADVPRPLARSGSALLLEYVGDQDGPASMLKDAQLTRDEGHAAWARLLENVGLLLACYVVHGDLSAYNVLWDGTRPVIIDFPQAMDPRFNGNAYSLLVRDLENLARYFARFGVDADASKIADELWGAYERP